MRRAPLLEVAPLAQLRPDPFDGERPYLATGGLDDEGRLTTELVNYSDRPSRADLEIRAGDICAARMQGTRKVFRFDESHESLLLSTGFVVFRPDTAQIHPRFLLHYLRTARFQADKDSLCTGATQRAINNGNLAKLEVPLPSLPDQERFVAMLDAAHRLLDLRRHAKAESASLEQSFFLDRFGDPVENPHGFPTCRLIDLADPERGISYGVVQRGKDVDDGIPLVRISDVIDGEIVPDTLVRTAPEVAGQYKRTALQGGEIVVSIRGTVGRCALVPPEIAGGNITRELALVPLKGPASAPFLLGLLRSPSVQWQLLGDVKGVAQRGINLSDLRELDVVQPPGHAIIDYVNVMARSAAMRSKQDESLSGVVSLIKRLQHEAFFDQAAGR